MGDTVLIVGASSKNGRATMRHVVDHGKAQVRATTRDPRKINQSGVEPVRFDWDDQTTWDAALAGISRLFLIVPEEKPNGPAVASKFLQRAIEGGVRRVVNLSARGVDEFPGHPLQQVDAAVIELAPEWAILRPNWFMQNFSEGLFLPNLRQHSVIRAPGGDARISFIDVDDIGAVAAVTLGDDTGLSLNAVHELTGPEALTFGEVAVKLSAAMGHEIKYQPLALDDPDLTTKLGLPGVDPRMVSALFGRVVAGGEAAVTDRVPALLGRAPITFDQFAANAARAWRRDT